MLTEMGPSRIDTEIRALGPNGGGSIDLLKCYLKFSTEVTRSKVSFEGGQAYLGLFLKVSRGAGSGIKYSFDCLI